MITAITLTFSPIWIPVFINFMWVMLMILSAANDEGWFAGAFQFLGAIFGTMFIWLVYFATMYFIVS